MYLVLSVIVHAGLLWIFVSSPQPENEEPPEAVEFEVVDVAEPKGFTRNSGNKGGVSLKNLSPKMKMSGDNIKYYEDHQGEGSYQDLESAYNPKSTWGAGSGNLHLIEYFIPLERLRIQVSGATHYPYVLAYHNITGNCNARLVIDDKGCNWALTRITPSEHHIRVYILSVLKKVCSFEDVKRLGIHRPINVDMAFAFQHTESIKPIDYSELRGNVIVVQRWYHKSKAEWHLGPFKGMFPVPQVYIDFTWLQENWNQYVENKNPFYEFDREYHD